MDLATKAKIRAAAGAAHDAYQHLVMAQTGAEPEDLLWWGELELGTYESTRSMHAAALAGAAAIIEKNLSDEESHDAWVDHLLAAGWRRGAKKNLAEKTHPGLGPLNEIDYQLVARNRVFCATVRLVAEAYTFSVPAV